MAVDLSDTLVVGISATALFDLTAAEAVFRQASADDPDTAVPVYRAYMLEREDEPLQAGTGLPLARALLGLNQHGSADASPLVEVMVLSRNSPETGMRVLKTIRRLGLPISRFTFTGGESVVDYLDAFRVDLFLTTDPADAQRVVDADQCAVAVLQPLDEEVQAPPDDQVRIAFDGDAVLFSEESELVYQTMGLDAFHEQEDASQGVPLGEGPYAAFLRKLARLQQRLPMRVENSPVRIALVTARSAPAELRVIETLRAWGVYVDEAFFLGGLSKAEILRALRPHIFFDDQDVHLERAARLIPSGKVPYRSDSPLHAHKGRPSGRRGPGGQDLS